MLDCVVGWADKRHFSRRYVSVSRWWWPSGSELHCTNFRKMIKNKLALNANVQIVLKICIQKGKPNGRDHGGPKTHCVHFSDMAVFFPVMVKLNDFLYIMKTDTIFTIKPFSVSPLIFNHLYISGLKPQTFLSLLYLTLRIWTTSTG